jgi:nucleoside-diphosphate-sugar epimerase
MADGRRFVLALLLSIGMSSATSSVAVIGGTGKLGRLAVEQLVRKNVPVRVLLRHDPAPASEASGAAEATAPQVAAWLKGMPGVTLVKGDVNDRESVSALLDGCSAVLALHGARRMRKVSDLWRDPSDEPTHSKQINYVGVQNIIDAARASGSCKRIVRVTGELTSWAMRFGVCAMPFANEMLTSGRLPRPQARGRTPGRSSRS